MLLPVSSTQGSTFLGAQGLMPLDFAVPLDFSD